jgi:hypothetical protein
MPKLRHLPPPTNTGRVFADRFSPYFQQPEAYDVRLEPAAAYGFIHRFDDASVRRLAYHFNMHSGALDRIEEAVAPMVVEQHIWSDHNSESALYWEDLGDRVIVTDERWGWDRISRVFGGAEAALLRLCWRITPWWQIQAELGANFTDEALHAGIDSLIGLGLLLQEKAELLALPLRRPVPGCTWIADKSRHQIFINNDGANKPSDDARSMSAV